MIYVCIGNIVVIILLSIVVFKLVRNNIDSQLKTIDNKNEYINNLEKATDYYNNKYIKVSSRLCTLLYLMEKHNSAFNSQLNKMIYDSLCTRCTLQDAKHNNNATVYIGSSIRSSDKVFEVLIDEADTTITELKEQKDENEN